MNPFYVIDSTLLSQLKWIKVEFNEPVSRKMKDSFFSRSDDSWMTKAFAWVPSNHTDLEWIDSRRQWPTWDDEVPKFSSDEWATELHRSLIDAGLAVTFKTRSSDNSMRAMVRSSQRYGIFTYWEDQGVYPSSQGFVLSMAAYHYFNGSTALASIEERIKGAA